MHIRYGPQSFANTPSSQATSKATKKATGNGTISKAARSQIRRRRCCFFSRVRSRRRYIADIYLSLRYAPFPATFFKHILCSFFAPPRQSHVEEAPPTAVVFLCSCSSRLLRNLHVRAPPGPITCLVPIRSHRLVLDQILPLLSLSAIAPPARHHWHVHRAIAGRSGIDAKSLECAGDGTCETFGVESSAWRG